MHVLLIIEFDTHVFYTERVSGAGKFVIKKLLSINTSQLEVDNRRGKLSMNLSIIESIYKENIRITHEGSISRIYSYSSFKIH